MGIDISAGLKLKLDEALQKAKKYYADGAQEKAAAEYRRCARIMKELVKSAVGVQTQKAHCSNMCRTRYSIHCYSHNGLSK